MHWIRVIAIVSTLCVVCPAVTAGEMGKLQGWMAGSFSSQTQAEADADEQVWGAEKGAYIFLRKP